MKRYLSAGIVFVVTANFCVAQSRPASSPASTSVPASSPVKTKIIPGPDTTRITSPLRPDGTVDYVAALNAEASKGVTKDNNAAVLLLDVLGPDFLPAEVRQKVYKILNITPDPKTPVFDGDLMSDPKYGPLQSKPWQAKDNPDAVEWLKNNAKALDLIIEASKRPRWYIPMVSSKENTSALMGVELPKISRYRTIIRALAMRANLAISEGRTQDAWADVQACYRLVTLIDQENGTLLFGRLTVIACSVLADQMACNLAASGKLDTKSARTILAQMPSLETVPGVIATIDQGERYVMLDMISLFSVLPETEAGSVASLCNVLNGMRKQSVNIPITKAFWEPIARGLNWNAVLQQVNSSYDRLVAIMGMTNLEERQKAYEIFYTDLNKMEQKTIKGPTANYPKNQWFAESMISLLIQDVQRFQTISNRAGVQRLLTSVAFALAAYKAEKGKYPAKLADLSPDYLKEVPKDFFAGGKDLIYNLTYDGGYILYSVGDNRQDDGGKDKSHNGDDLLVRSEGK